jgi:hypothetical protein
MLSYVTFTAALGGGRIEQSQEERKVDVALEKCLKKVGNHSRHLAQ